MSGSVLVVIGAGEAQALPEDWRTVYSRLILIEPIPVLAAALRERFAEMAAVEVIEAALVPDDDTSGKTTLQVFSWGPASSRHAPAELLTLFPGLELERVLRVHSLTLSACFADCDIASTAENGLIVDAPGDGLALIDGLINAKWHQAFAWLQVREPAPGLYSAGSGLNAILQRLSRAGYTETAVNESDPEWPFATLKHDPNSGGILDETHQDCLDARAQWAAGEWSQLAELDNTALPEHPARVTLGIYAACGHQQLDNRKAEQRCVDAVLSWGAEKCKVKRFLLSGIYNRLGKANAYLENYKEAAAFFRKSFDTILPDMEERQQYIQRRISNELDGLTNEELKNLYNEI